MSEVQEIMADREPAAAHGFAKSQTRLSNRTTHLLPSLLPSQSPFIQNSFILLRHLAFFTELYNEHVSHVINVTFAMASQHD